MSNFHEDLSAFESELPLPVQLTDFATLIREIIIKSRNINTYMDEIGSSSAVDYSLGGVTKVIVGIGRGELFSPDTVDVEVRNYAETGIHDKQVVRSFAAAYSPSLEETSYRDETKTFIKGHEVRSKGDIEYLQLIQSVGQEEALRLICMSQEELLHEDGPLAKTIWERRTGYSLEDMQKATLTKGRLGVFLEILRYIHEHPELEELSDQEAEKILRSIYADDAPDKED